MTAHWMAYCLAVGTLLAVGAVALERALAAFGRPTRWAWAGALLLALAIPAAARLTPAEPPPAAPALPAATESAEPAPARAAALPAAARPGLDLRALDRPLLAAWGASSAAALLVLAALAAVLERRRRRWRAAAVDGVPVLVSPDTGPAVVGVLRSRIVLPEWACAADAEVRALMLEHEREHVRAGDPRLLAAGLLALAAMPWSPAAWWMLRRLRLAMEVDCDARVLRRRGDVRAYGTLLLEMGRRAGGSRLAVAAFSEPTSFLERRIRTMTAPTVRNPLLRAAGFGAVAAALAVAACETPGPVHVAPAAIERVHGAEDGTRPRIDLRAVLARHYPDVLTSGTGRGATLTLVLSPEGEIVHHELHRAPAPAGGVTASGQRLRVQPVLSDEFSPEDFETIDVMRFAAGQMGPDPLGVVTVQLGQPGTAGEGARIRVRGEAATELSLQPAGDESAPAEGTRVRIRGQASAPSPLQPGGDETASDLRAGTTPAETIEAALRQAYPRPEPGGEYWMVADAAGRVIRSGATLDSAPLERLQPAGIEAMQVQRLRIEGVEIKVLWVQLKPGVSL